MKNGMTTRRALEIVEQIDDLVRFRTGGYVGGGDTPHPFNDTRWLTRLDDDKIKLILELIDVRLMRNSAEAKVLKGLLDEVIDHKNKVVAEE
jgi:hypothetical protein